MNIEYPLYKSHWYDIRWDSHFGCRSGCFDCWARAHAKELAPRIARKYIKWLDPINAWKMKLPGHDARYKMWVKRFEKYNRWIISNVGDMPYFPEGTKRVLCNTWCDIRWWGDEWVKLIEQIKEHPEIDFIFLTRGGLQVYKDLDAKGYSLPGNVIKGIVATRDEDIVYGCKGIGQYALTNRMLLYLRLDSKIMEPGAQRLGGEFQWMVVGRGVTVMKYEWFGNMLFNIDQRVWVHEALRDITPEPSFRQELFI